MYERLAEKDETAARNTIVRHLAAQGGVRVTATAAHTRHPHGRDVLYAGHVLHVGMYSYAALRVYIRQEHGSHANGELSFLPAEAEAVAAYLAAKLKGEPYVGDLAFRDAEHARDWLPGTHLYAWTRAADAAQDAHQEEIRAWRIARART